MLIQFSAQNTFSIKDKVVLSLLAGADKEHPSHLINLEDQKKKCLKASIIYGANASGKSNVINAFWYMVDFVLNSHEKQLGRPTGRIPFRFDKKCPSESSSFEVIFVQGKVRYAYGFSATETEVTEEYLYHYANGRQAVVFERKNTDEYRFTSDIDLQNSLKERNSPNKLYLSTAANWNYEKVKAAFAWFSECRIICKFSPTDAYGLNAALSMDKAYLDKIAKMLQVADLGIKALNLKEGIDEDSEKRIGQSRQWDMKFSLSAIHQVVGSDNSPELYSLDMGEESDGTNSYLQLIGIVQKVLEKGGLLVADEMDAHLHPLLSKHILTLFNSAEYNPYGAQLIFTSHNTNLLDLDILRRDQIWFTEKDERTAATDLFSLDDFSVRKDNKVERSYLLGKFGAVPFIKGGLQ